MGCNKQHGKNQITVGMVSIAPATVTTVATTTTNANTTVITNTTNTANMLTEHLKSQDHCLNCYGFSPCD